MIQLQKIQTLQTGTNKYESRTMRTRIVCVIKEMEKKIF